MTIKNILFVKFRLFLYEMFQHVAKAHFSISVTRTITKKHK